MAKPIDPTAHVDLLDPSEWDHVSVDAELSRAMARHFDRLDVEVEAYLRRGSELTDLVLTVIDDKAWVESVDDLCTRFAWVEPTIRAVLGAVQLERGEMSGLVLPADEEIVSARPVPWKLLVHPNDRVFGTGM